MVVCILSAGKQSGVSTAKEARKTAVVDSKHCQKVTTTWRVLVSNQKAVELRHLCLHLQPLITAHIFSIGKNTLKKIKCFALLLGSHLLNHKGLFRMALQL